MRTMIFALALAVAVPVGLNAQDPVAVAEGARVWASNCTRCHNARPSQERTDGQWLTIVLHMRARANLTRADANVVATFLQATNLPESPAPITSAQAPVTPERDEEEAEEVGGPDGTGEAEARPELGILIRYLQGLSSVP